MHIITILKCAKCKRWPNNQTVAHGCGRVSKLSTKSLNGTHSTVLLGGCPPASDCSVVVALTYLDSHGWVLGRSDVHHSQTSLVKPSQTPCISFFTFCTPGSTLEAPLQKVNTSIHVYVEQSPTPQPWTLDGLYCVIPQAYLLCTHICYSS